MLTKSEKKFLACPWPRIAPPPPRKTNRDYRLQSLLIVYVDPLVIVSLCCPSLSVYVDPLVYCQFMLILWSKSNQIEFLLFCSCILLSFYNHNLDSLTYSCIVLNNTFKRLIRASVTR